MLILSAVEFGVGLVILLFQHTITRSLQFNVDETSVTKYALQRSKTQNLYRSS